MINNIIFLFLFFLTSSCTYSFQGTSLPSEVKTFSVDKFYNDVLDFPIDNVEGIFSQKMIDKILKSTTLKQVDNGADIDFRGGIIKYNLSDNLDRVTLTVKVEYINAYSEKESFNKTFSKSMSLNDDGELNKNILDDLLNKIVDDILYESIYKW